MRAVIFDWGGTLKPWQNVDHPWLWRLTAVVTKSEQICLGGALPPRQIPADSALVVAVHDLLVTGRRSSGYDRQPSLCLVGR